jgi:hypothetical protein
LELRGRETIVKYIRTQKVKYWGPLNRMEETKAVRESREWSFIGMRFEGR